MQTILQLLSDIRDTSDINDRARESIIRYMNENSVTGAELMALVKVFPAQTAKKINE